MADLDSAVAAVLAVTPTDRAGYIPYGPDDVDGIELEISGPPEPVAAMQAAAVLRWAARDLGLTLCAADANRLDELADAIEAQCRASITPVAETTPEPFVSGHCARGRHVLCGGRSSLRGDCRCGCHTGERRVPTRTEGDPA